mgnify:FL=1
MTLTDRIKKLLGRKINQETIERAKRRESDESEERKIEYGLIGDNPVIVDSRFEYCTTPDFSYGWARPHTGYYKSKKIKNVYNPDGNLVFRETWTGDLPNHGTRNYRVVKFEPAGSILPRKTDSRELTDYLDIAKNAEKKAKESK